MSPTLQALAAGVRVRTLSPQDAHTDRGVVHSISDYAPVALVSFDCGCRAYVRLARLEEDTRPAPPVCEALECERPRWGGLYCPGHQHLRGPGAPSVSDTTKGGVMSASGGNALAPGESFEPTAGQRVAGTAPARTPPIPARAQRDAIDDVRTPGATSPAPTAPRPGRAIAADGGMDAGARDGVDRPDVIAGSSPAGSTAEAGTSTPAEARRAASPRPAPDRQVTEPPSSPAAPRTGTAGREGVDGLSAGTVRPARGPVAGGGPYWTRERVIEAMKAWHARTGKVPTRSAWLRAADDHPAANTVRYAFGSWTAGVEAAGFEVNGGGRPQGSLVVCPTCQGTGHVAREAAAA